MELKFLKAIQVQVQNDERGDLMISEMGSSPLFDVRRIYAISNVNSTAVRGQHAHKALQQIFFALKGSFHLNVTDGIHFDNVVVSEAQSGFYLPSGFWRELTEFSEGAVCLVLASLPYSKDDYIHNFDEYLVWRNTK